MVKDDMAIHILGAINKLNKRFDALEEEFENVNKRFDEIENKFEHVDVKFSEVDEEFRQLQNAVINTRYGLATLINDVSRKITLVSTPKDKLSSLDTVYRVK